MAGPLAAQALARFLVGPRDADGASGVADHDAPDERTTHVFLAEHYLSGVDEQRVDVLTNRLRVAANGQRRSGVRFLGLAGLPGDDSFLSIFAASSAEAVARTIERAELAVDRIVPVLWRAGES